LASTSIGSQTSAKIPSMLSSLYRNLLVFCIRSQLQRLQKAHLSRYKVSLPVIVVAGSVGKSSTTLLISQLLARNGLHVLTSTTTTKNYNTLSGLAMMLSRQYFSMDAVGRLRGWMRVLWQLMRTCISPIFFNGASVLVFEMGVDHQGESRDFAHIFTDIDVLVVTAATTEHSMGYSAEFDSKLYHELKNTLPSSLTTDFESRAIDSALKNSVLENLRLAKNAVHAVLPEHIGTLTDAVLYSTDSGFKRLSHSSITRDTHGYLIANDAPVFPDSQYLLPATFARNQLILQHIAEILQLKYPTLDIVALPVSRFSRFAGIHESVIVDSTYNSDPASLSGFLDIFEQMETAANCHTMVLGEMRELGAAATQAHQDALDHLKQLTARYPSIHTIYLIGSQWQHGTLANHPIFLQQNFIHSLSSRLVATALKTTIIPSQWVWCKGSQNTIFCEEVVTALLANPTDVAQVCRQSDEWKQQKDLFFASTPLTKSR
jgi:UDP-N-acetylmuramyl pentapeptide synthase